MISYLKGILIEKTPTHVVIDVEGVGFELSIPLSSYETIGPVNEHTRLLTYLQVRDDSIALYGFASEEERRLFLHLISVSGIGPKLAQGILSGNSPEELRRHISDGDIDALAKIRGVGKKTAQRLVIDLRDKLTGIKDRAGDLLFFKRGAENTVIEEALLALISLGYTRSTAQSIMERTLAENVARGDTISVEELIKRALRNA